MSSGETSKARKAHLNREKHRLLDLANSGGSAAVKADAERKAARIAAYRKAMG